MMASGLSAPVFRSFTLLILTASAGSVTAAQQPERAPQARDSLRARVGGFDGDIERLAAQLLMTTQRQSQVRQGLQALLSGQIAEANRAEAEVAVRRLREQLEQASRQTQMLRTQLASLCDRNAKPQGYMGITFTATMSADAAASGTEVFRFAENPTVETVEPGSPAESAGVEKGDEIILIDGRNVVGRDIVFARLLRPGTRLPLRVRRDGDTRDVTLEIKQRPPSLDNGCPFLDARIMAAFGDPISIGPMSGAIVRAAPLPPNATTVPGARVRVMRMPEPATPAAAGGNAVVTVTPAPMVPNIVVPTPAVADAPPAPRSVFAFSGGPSAPVVIAGATVVRANPDLLETFGVKRGVLVLDVARGSPAYNSGLKGGDVIVVAGRVAVTSPLSIQRAIEAADASEVPLRVIRKKKEQSLTLKW